MNSSMQRLFSLEGQTALVTGGSSGLGQQMAIALAEGGADIILVQRDVTNTKTKSQIDPLGRRCTIITGDMSSAESAASVLPTALSHLASGSRLSIMLVCHGMQRRHLPEEFPTSDWDLVIQTNLSSVFTLCRDVGTHMLTNTPDAWGQRGSIINIASVLSYQGGIQVPAYAASKGGIAQLTKALSNDWARRGVRVNAIAPGYCDTAMNDALMKNEKRSEEILGRIPAGRWGKPEDFKGSIVFLASAASAWVTGEMLTVDGGWMGR